MHPHLSLFTTKTTVPALERHYRWQDGCRCGHNMGYSDGNQQGGPIHTLYGDSMFNILKASRRTIASGHARFPPTSLAYWSVASKSRPNHYRLLVRSTRVWSSVPGIPNVADVIQGNPGCRRPWRLENKRSIATLFCKVSRHKYMPALVGRTFTSGMMPRWFCRNQTGMKNVLLIQVAKVLRNCNFTVEVGEVMFPVDHVRKIGGRGPDELGNSSYNRSIFNGLALVDLDPDRTFAPDCVPARNKCQCCGIDAFTKERKESASHSSPSQRL